MALLIHSVSSLAAVFQVNTTADLTDQLPGDGLCASASGACSLRAAIQESNTTSTADHIQLAAGEYLISIPGIDEDQAGSGDLDVSQPVIISGASSNQTIINAQLLDRIFDLLPHNEEATTVLTGLTLTQGQYDAFNVPVGAAMLINEHDVELTDVVITGNQTKGRGAAALHIDNSCLVGTAVRISHNSGQQASTTVYIDGADACLELDTFSITDNHTDDHAAIFFNTSVTALLRRGLIARNQSRSSTLLLNIGNLVTMENVTISANQANGAILNDGGSELFIRHSTITNNTGVNGLPTTVGGIMDVHGGTGLVFLTNSIVTGNGPGSLADDISRGNSLLGGNLLGEVTGYASLASDELGVALQLGPLQDLGGFADGHRPDVFWVDRGEMSACTETDQRGITRPQDGDQDGQTGCDAGAIELISDVLFADDFE